MFLLIETISKLRQYEKYPLTGQYKYTLQCILYLLLCASFVTKVYFNIGYLDVVCHYLF